MRSAISFAFRTGKITINLENCARCVDHPCINACRLYGAGLFQLTGANFGLIHDIEETGRRCIEDLACEIYCHRNGNQGLEIHLDMFGLEAYREKIGLR